MLVEPRAVLVIGAQAAGKSAVGRRLAERVDRGAFIEGDLLWKMVVSGRVDMSATPDDEAERQLEMRYRHGSMLAESFVGNGFLAVHADNIYGEAVERHLRSLHCPRSLVVLRPRPEVIERRMANARVEVAQAKHFDFVIINALFEAAVFDLKTIVHSQRLKFSAQRRTKPAVFTALDLD